VYVSKSKEDEADYGIAFSVIRTAAGSLAVRSGHPGSPAGAEEPPPVPKPTAAEQRIWNEVIAYVREHGGEDGLSFRRINDGVKGTQATKQQQLDLAVRYMVLTRTKGKRYAFWKDSFINRAPGDDLPCQADPEFPWEA